ncbi:MAG: 30S ribosomal protein S20 [Gammaproteobacteria bacterium]
MANTAQSKKRVRQNETRRVRNMGLRTKMRTYIKKVVAAIATGNKTVAQEAFKEAVPVIDTMVTKKIIHKNKAARHKSRLSAHIKALAS